MNPLLILAATAVLYLALNKSKGKTFVDGEGVKWPSQRAMEMGVELRKKFGVVVEGMEEQEIADLFDYLHNLTMGNWRANDELEPKIKLIRVKYRIVTG